MKIRAFVIITRENQIEDIFRYAKRLEEERDIRGLIIYRPEVGAHLPLAARGGFEADFLAGLPKGSEVGAHLRLARGRAGSEGVGAPKWLERAGVDPIQVGVPGGRLGPRGPQHGDEGRWEGENSYTYRPD